jgi:hypothetical protein
VKYVRTPPILAVKDSRGPFHAFSLATNGIDGGQRGKKWWTDRIGGGRWYFCRFGKGGILAG